MNEYQEQRLTEELRATVDRMYASQVSEWEKSGAKILRAVSITPVPKTGKHRGEAIFTFITEGKPPSERNGVL